MISVAALISRVPTRTRSSRFPFPRRNLWISSIDVQVFAPFDTLNVTLINRQHFRNFHSIFNYILRKKSNMENIFFVCFHKALYLVGSII